MREIPNTDKDERPSRLGTPVSWTHFARRSLSSIAHNVGEESADGSRRAAKAKETGKRGGGPRPEGLVTCDHFQSALQTGPVIILPPPHHRFPSRFRISALQIRLRRSSIKIQDESTSRSGLGSWDPRRSSKIPQSHQQRSLRGSRRVLQELPDGWAQRGDFSNPRPSESL